jgi:hypothetical protein
MLQMLLTDSSASSLIAQLSNLRGMNEEEKLPTLKIVAGENRLAEIRQRKPAPISPSCAFLGSSQLLHKLWSN